MPSLPPEVIGDVGELLVHRLCRLAGLDVSQPIPDRTAKDRVIEWGFVEPTGGMTYDTRPAPLSCVVQVKSSGHSKLAVRLSLAGAERLARDQRPTFVAAPRFDDNGKELDLHLIHFRGPVLRLILKRLRREQAKIRKKRGSATLTIPIALGDRVALQPAALREALETHIGGNMAVYAAQKQQELDSVGFDQPRFSLSVRFPAMTPEQHVDALISFEPIPCSEIQHSESRFGIILPGWSGFPQFQSMGGSILISPGEADVCRISAKNSGGDEVAVEAKYIAPPAGIPKKFFKIRFRTEIFDIVLGLNKANLTLRSDELSKIKPMSTWRDCFKFLSIVGDAKAELHFTRLSDGLSTTAKLGVSYPGAVDDLISICSSLFEGLDRVQKSCGFQEPVGSLAQFLKSRDDVATIARLISNEIEPGAFEFVTRSETSLAEVGGRSFILFLKISIFGFDSSIALKTWFDISKENETSAVWTAGQLEFLAGEPTPNEATFGAFREKLSRISGVSNFVTSEFP